VLEDGLSRLALRAVSERDVQRLLERAVVLVAESLGAVHAQIFELLPDGETLLSRVAVGGERRALNRVRSGERQNTQASFTLTTGAPVISRNLPRETRFRASRSQRAASVVTAISVPLFGRGGRPYGVLEVGWTTRPPLPADEISDFLQGAGHLLVTAVERARVEAACRFLAESEVRLVSAGDFRESVVALASLAVPKLADWCCIDVVLPRGAIETVAIVHADSALVPVVRTSRLRIRFDPAAESGIASVLRTAVAEFHNDLGAALSAPAEEGDLVAELAEAAGFRAAIVTPLVARRHVFGTITLVAEKSRRPFDEGDLLLANAFASQVALALDNVRLFFGKGREVTTLPQIAGVTSGVALLDPETLGTRLLGTLTAETDRLTHVVNSVVLATKLAPAREEGAAEVCDIVPVVSRATETIRGTLPASWSLEFLPPTVLTPGDAATIRRIVSILIDNAVTYSPTEGSVAVRLEATDAGVRLIVEDSGIGISPSERDVVFEKFYRGAAARSLRSDGIGLGLYICRALASRLNGTVEILDRQGPGTAVCVELPLASRSAASAEVVSLDPEGSERILRRREEPP
jgi:signal transduction histidine kinase